MAYGIETYRPNGSVNMTGSNRAGMFIEVLRVSYTQTTGSKVYPQIPAGSMFVMVGDRGSGAHNFTVDSDGAGHARLNWTPGYQMNPFASNIDTFFIVFAKKVNKTDTYGVDIPNDDGDDALDYTYPVPQYAGTVQPAAAPSRSGYCADGYNYWTEHKVNVSMRSNTNRIVLVSMPDSSSNNIWYGCRTFLPAGEGTSTLTLTIVRPTGSAYVVPTLHIFSLDGPISGGGSYGLQFFNPAGALVYDSSAENVSISDMTDVKFGGYGGPPTAVPMRLPAVAGVSVPYMQYEVHTDTAGNTGYWRRWMSLAQRRGGSILYQTKYMDEVYTSDPSGSQLYFSSFTGAVDGCHSLVVDIEQLGYGGIPGIK